MRPTNPKCFHLSASCIQAFKACPTRFRLAYREGLRVDRDTDALRMGTNWHALHEEYRNALQQLQHDEIGTEETAEEMALNHVRHYLATAYEIRPGWKMKEEWEHEKAVLMTSFLAYLWYYQDDDIEYLHQELCFDLPVHSPKTGMPLPMDEVKRVGKIDHIVRFDGCVGPIERKSSSRDISPGSQFWEKSAKDTQVSMYALAITDLLNSGELPEELGITDDDVIGNTLYDVWRKPTTKPKFLSVAASLDLIKTGEYHGEEFIIDHAMMTITKTVKKEEVEVEVIDPETILIDCHEAEVELTKTGFKIRESIDMYASRLMQDIVDKPETYFQRKEIARSKKELRKFRQELFNIYQSMRMMDKSGTWFENEQQCRATFPCGDIPICYGEGADKVCDGKTIPAGFKRIFSDVTVEGDPINGD